jgi:glycosyltransferase involved in cell wall biosynthesis
VRILALALGIPFPPVGGGLTRTFQLLRALSSHHEVALAAFTYGEPHERPPFPVHVEPVPWQWSDAYREMTGDDPDAAHRAYTRLTFEDGHPWFVSVLDPVPMEEVLKRILGTRPDLVLLEGTPLARFLPTIPHGVPRVLDLFDIHSEMERRALEQSPPGEREARSREAERTLRFERDAAQSCDACLTVSENDAVAAATILGAPRVHVVPNGVDTSYFTPSPSEPERGALLFTGRMSYEPNADAVCFFAKEVLPLIRREAPHARLHIVGAGPPPRVAALASDSVIVHGRVDDIRPHQWNADVVVVPVRAGGGTRLKVLEAAACGKGIVTTSLGVEGLAFRAGRDLLVADSPSAFAAAVVRLLRDSAHRDDLGARARAAACRYEWAAIGKSFRQLMEDIAAR